LKIVDSLGIEGGCNVQFALDPGSLKYYVIEVNPRLSRSSALASKATGYPIAKVATKIALGLSLDEIKNDITGKTYACFEPSLDYVVIKFPRWPFDKFNLAERTVDTQMKSTGEIMAIDRTFEGAFQKAIRSLEIGLRGLETSDYTGFSPDILEGKLMDAEDLRMFHLAEAFKRGMSVDRAAELTSIDKFFLNKIKGIIDFEKEFSTHKDTANLPANLLLKAKQLGFADSYLAGLVNTTEEDIRNRRLERNIRPVYKLVDTCAAEFEAVTPYYYSTYEQENEAVTGNQKRKVVVLGAGPIRIGQGIEFDYCSVHSVWALREEGMESIIINNNPETVSTDFDTSDRLYFEPLVAEDVLDVLETEQPDGVIVQFGGQTAINLAKPLEDAGIKILGTTVSDIDRAEDRERFDRLLIELGIPKPAGSTAFSVEEASAIAGRIGFPVLVRPSYVLGGRAMEIVYNQEELVSYMETAAKINPEHPVLVDSYLFGKELEVDAVCDGEDVLIPGIMEHIERAGVHSGDSIAVYPPRKVGDKAKQQIVDYTTRLAMALNVKGMINIQYVLHNDNIYVLEVNPRSSRTVPYISKITGIPLVNLATKVIFGKKLRDMGYEGGMHKETQVIGVKAPVFSFEKLLQVDISLGPEMKSTGEVMGVNKSFPVALYKALVASGCVFPKNGTVLVTVADKDKKEALPIIKGLADLGYEILATSGTAGELDAEGISVTKVNKIGEGSPHIVDLIRESKVHLVINTLTKGKMPQRDGFKIRRAAVEYGIPCLTSLDTASALVNVLSSFKEEENLELIPLQDYLKQ
ncbi:MAG TPA: carbamoyl-phosphate synthase large subunit, partial [Clostridia bacterium]|nr:carbamoyl-phosphate synthase large subunit [Clostridia bacterium]